MKKIILLTIILILSISITASAFDVDSHTNSNNEKLNITNVKQWHDMGYTGKGVKVIISDSNNNHGRSSIEVIKQIAPDVEIIESLDGLIDNGVYIALNNNAQIVTASLTPNHTFRDTELKLYKKAYDKGIFLNGSSGNRKEDYNKYLENLHWFSTGAVTLNGGKVARASYSSYGEGLDVMGITDFQTSYGSFGGTSCATPFVSGMLALHYQRFKEINGRFPTVSEARNFVYENTMDLEAKGYDIYTGYGLFILPKLNLRNEIKVDKNNHLAVKMIRHDNLTRYVHVDWVERYVKDYGYKLGR